MDQVPNDNTPEAKVKFQERFDKAINEYMKQQGISQGAICIARGAEELIHQGYGVNPDTVFRLASITKPITRAAIKSLILGGSVSLDTKAFPLINLQPPKSGKVNPELEQITIQQLLNHSGGWDISVMGYDPTFQKDPSSKLPAGLSPVEAVRLILQKPLQFEPGTKSVYSNLGYLVLGRVIEEVSGQSYEKFIQERLMKPLGATTIRVGSSEKSKPGSNEAVYESSEIDPYKDFNIETLDSCGGLAGSAADYCKFMQAYWIGTGDKRKGDEKSTQRSLGGLPGTKTMALQRKDGSNIVVLFNRRNLENPKDYEEIQELVESFLT